MTTIQDICLLCQKVRAEKPLVHNITNYVTVNDCANAILAVGGSPIMADDLNEVGEIVQIAKALVINIGTLNERTIGSMVAAGKRANDLGIPVVFDPVGAGASKFRNIAARRILNNVKVSVVRGNLSEISFLAGLDVSTKGVDVSSDISEEPVEVAKSLATQLNTTVAITGAVDVISDGGRTAKIRNGVESMSGVTGTGCMTTAILGAFHGVTKDSYLASITAISAMGIAGEGAWEEQGQYGMGSFHIGIIDKLSKMDCNCIKERIKIEEL